MFLLVAVKVVPLFGFQSYIIYWN